MNRTYCVYVLASRSRNLYTGVTGDLERRLAEHRQGLIPGFTTRYRIFRLVHFEFFTDIRAAIAHEKEIKGWRREKKIWLIQRNNPTWADLAEKIPHQYGPIQIPKQIPHPRSRHSFAPASRGQKNATGFGMTGLTIRARIMTTQNERHGFAYRSQRVLGRMARVPQVWFVNLGSYLSASKRLKSVL